ncbi:LPD1 domain-containing protein [Hyphomicrobiales bacterium]|jgi:hypothetical protein|nr:LPD1 domain-containing protein [Hyphomicrobiales bacterium]CAH1702868.1 LPD1 domain-containing protein [Hyphomicrobiales bacterium]CAI0347055.1 LPD1 domain-containing protein [Hyphomicrobiales bacterium]
MSQIRKVDDAGEKIGGARKDMWRSRVMTPEDLDALSIEEAVAFVSKDLVWPKPDYAALAEAGFEPEALALQKIVRDRLPAAAVIPDNDKPDQEQRRIHRQYVEMVSLLRDVAARLKTAAEMRVFHNEIYTELDWHQTGWRSNEVRSKIASVTSGRKRPYELKTADLDKASAMVREGFPSSKVDPWLKGVLIKQRAGEFYAVRGRTITTKGHATHEAAVAALKAAYQEKRTKKADTPKMPPMYRERLDEIVREGLPARRDGSVSPEAFIEEFGFRGVEFGEWLPDGERQMVLDHAWDAFCDLAEVLDIPRTSLSLGGNLALAFGARGNGQAAHYEPLRAVFNVSRLSGAGSVAHEYGHFLDHYAGQKEYIPTQNGSIASGSGWYEWSLPRAGRLSGLGSELAGMWDRMMETIRMRRLSREEHVAALDSKIAYHAERIASETKRLETFIASGGEQRDGKFVGKMQTWLRREAATEQSVRARREAFLNNPSLPGAAAVSHFFTEALKLGGANGYWQRPTETFARAFECAVFDALKKAGARSDYLVHGVEPELYADAIWKGNPYPVGDEREAITSIALDLSRAIIPAIVSKFEQEPEPAPVP